MKIGQVFGCGMERAALQRAPRIACSSVRAKWIESALRHLIDIALGKMKRQEDLARSDDLRDAQLDLAHTARAASSLRPDRAV